MSLLGKSIGNYRITAKLGEGGMGAVYLGEHPLIGKKVAIKVLLDDLAAKEDIVARFFNEAKSVNDIGHSNIVDIVDFGKCKDESRELVYFVMEYLDGQSLSGRLRSAGLSFPESLHVMRQCCSALAASHEKGIVHRDLKPENIYLCPRAGDKNFVKILDFGIAKLTGHGSTSSKTRTGLVIGTPAYMSPEQCEGKGQIDHRSDIYSLGVVMYELITGKVPFASEGFGDILVAHIMRQPDKPSTVNAHVTPELDAIVMHALEKDRNRRFQSMAEFEAALADPAAHLKSYTELPAHSAGKHSGSTLFLDDSNPPPRGPVTRIDAPEEPRPTTLSGAAAEVSRELERPTLPRRRSPLVAVAAGLVVLGLAGAGFVMTRHSEPAVQPAPPAEMITIMITSDPPGARVVGALQGDLGKTPLPLQVKRGSDSFDVRLHLDGYRTGIATVTTDSPKALHVGLAHEEPPPAPAPAPAPVVAAPEPPPAPAPVATPTKKPSHKHTKKAEPHDEDVLMKPDFL
jgi:serine/threonine-protein kinase